MIAKRETKATSDAEFETAIAAVRARKAVTTKPEPRRDLRVKPTMKPTVAKTKRRSKNHGPGADITARGRRQPGSGWAGKRQR